MLSCVTAPEQTTLAGWTILLPVHSPVAHSPCHTQAHIDPGLALMHALGLLRTIFSTINICHAKMKRTLMLPSGPVLQVVDCAAVAARDAVDAAGGPAADGAAAAAGDSRRAALRAGPRSCR